MNWFKQLFPSRITTSSAGRKGTVPEGLWKNCSNCAAILYQAELARNCYVCSRCEHHMRINARIRIDSFLDKEHRLELGVEVKPIDKLKFKDSKRYKDRLYAAQKKTNETDALVVVAGELLQHPVVVAAFEFAFIGGSMGAVVGDKFVIAVHYAISKKIPFICFATSGGARMQEAAISLMQMGKTSAAIAKLSQNKLPFISVLSDPTYGGVSASFAMLGDIIIAEPKAMIGFTGPRVIKQTVRQTLPDGFQQSEFLLKHGQIDLILDRREMRNKINKLLVMMTHYE